MDACVAMKALGLSDEQTFDLIWNHYNPRAIPPWKPREIERKISLVKVRREPGRPAKLYRLSRTSREPKQDSPLPRIKAVLNTHSPIKYSGDWMVHNRVPLPEPPAPWYFASRLFRDTELVCATAEIHSPLTLPLSQWMESRPRWVQFIVSSPMLAEEGLTREGKESSRALSNTGPSRYQVIEFDPDPKQPHGALLTIDNQARIHFHLSHFAPLVMIVHSGKKSLHGWYLVENMKPQKHEAFFNYACSLGADPQLEHKTHRHQLVRFPDGHRQSNHETQRVLYFNPELCPNV